MPTEPVRVAVLDDYQGVATKLADWTVLPKHVELTVFRDTVAGEDAVTSRLRPFEIVCAMRERTPFLKRQLERLPNLRLLVTTAMRNNSIDLVAARERGITVCGTRSSGDPTTELTWTL